jgi:hypothetical protein
LKVEGTGTNGKEKICSNCSVHVLQAQIQKKPEAGSESFKNLYLTRYYANKKYLSSFWVKMENKNVEGKVCNPCAGGEAAKNPTGSTGG